MAEILTGVRAALSRPRIYEAVQSLMGADAGRRMFADEFVKAKPGDRILDIGCGPAELLSYLPDVDYIGFDPNPAYIEQARSRFGERGTFRTGILGPSESAGLGAFDIAIVCAVLHHLDDHEAEALLHLLRKLVKPGGRVVTLDPVFVPDQSFVARWIISNDRGQNVRTPEGYQALASRAFGEVTVAIRHKSFPPYTHCWMTLS